jgi:hypothetical protein
MGPRPHVTERYFYRQSLLKQINLKHPLAHLADLIGRDWAQR